MNELTTKERDKQTLSTAIPDRWIGYWSNDTEGEMEMEFPKRYAILLVLEGEITLSFKGYTNKTIGEKSLVVIDQYQIKKCRWSAGTAILEFTPPKKIFRFFGGCSRVFQIPCSTVVPVYPELQTWIDDLMAERLQPAEELTHILHRNYCVRLMNILNGYPPLLVGELLVPFHACSLSGEKKCKGELCV